MLPDDTMACLYINLTILETAQWPAPECERPAPECERPAIECEHPAFEGEHTALECERPAKDSALVTSAIALSALGKDQYIVRFIHSPCA